MSIPRLSLAVQTPPDKEAIAAWLADVKRSGKHEWVQASDSLVQYTRRKKNRLAKKNEPRWHTVSDGARQVVRVQYDGRGLRGRIPSGVIVVTSSNRAERRHPLHPPKTAAAFAADVRP